MAEIILASASPRRAELLRLMGLDFTVTVSDADESLADKSVRPGLYVQETALLKAAAAVKKTDKGRRQNAIVISADTIVVNDGEILGKPKDDEDAFRMLRSLSGRTHSVYTGFCVMRLSDAYTVCKDVCTDVTFARLSDEKIRRYIATGEPADKAGAYGIQGVGAMLVEKIDGDFYNVVGLPVCALAKVLEDDFDYILI